MNTLPSQELERRLHASLPHPGEWRVVRFELDVSYETGLLAGLVLGFRSTSGQTKRLRFANPQMSEFGPLRISELAAVYVADLGDLGWARERSVEVGEWEDDRPVLFWAASVEEVA